MSPADAATFLEATARYFETRPTHGEDAAHWANVYNAKNCREIAGLLAAPAQVDQSPSGSRPERA